MISLRAKILESLLDDEETLLDDSSMEIESIIDEYDIRYNINQVKILGNILDLGNAWFIKENPEHPLSYFSKSLDTLKSKSSISLHINNTNVLDDQTLCPNYIASEFECTFPKDILIKNINITNDSGVTLISKNRELITLQDMVIRPNNQFSGIFLYTSYFPKFKNVSVTKDIRLWIKHLDFEKQYNIGISDSLNNVMNNSYIFEVWDAKKMLFTPSRKSNMKNIFAFLKHIDKKVAAGSQLFKFKANTKITDIIPNLPKNIKRIDIVGKYSGCSIISPGKYDESNFKTELGQYYDITNDGWLVEIKRI